MLIAWHVVCRCSGRTFLAGQKLKHTQVHAMSTQTSSRHKTLTTTLDRKTSQQRALQIKRPAKQPPSWPANRPILDHRGHLCRSSLLHRCLQVCVRLNCLVMVVGTAVCLLRRLMPLCDAVPLFSVLLVYVCLFVCVCACVLSRLLARVGSLPWQLGGLAKCSAGASGYPPISAAALPAYFGAALLTLATFALGRLDCLLGWFGGCV